MFFEMYVGLPASGKDSYYNEYDKDNPNVIMVSSDAIREEVFGDINDQTHNEKVFDIMYKRTIEAFQNGKSVVYNATNLVQKRRIHLLSSLKAVAARNNWNIRWNCVLFVTLPTTCAERNLNRDRTVPSSVMLRMLKRFQPPHKCEGWDNIVILNYHPDVAIPVESIVIYGPDQPHDNPHHSLSINEHMISAAFKYKHNFIGDKNCHIKSGYEDNIFKALLYHDCGKHICKTFINAKGENTKIAHYYNHENVGAYIYLSGVFCEDGLNNNPYEVHNALEIANLIAHHMDFYKGENYLNKICKLYGEDFYRKLKIIHQYDELAH